MLYNETSPVGLLLFTGDSTTAEKSFELFRFKKKSRNSFSNYYFIFSYLLSNQSKIARPNLAYKEKKKIIAQKLLNLRPTSQS